MVESGPSPNLLSAAPEVLYNNGSSSVTDFNSVVSMIMCNTGSSIYRIYMCITDDVNNPRKGAIVYGLKMDPNESLSIEDRRIGPNQMIVAWSDVADVMSFSFDIKIP